MMRRTKERKLSFWQQGFGAMDFKHCIVWLQIILLICSEVVETVVTSNDLPPPTMVTIAPSPSSSSSAVNSVTMTQQLPSGIPMQTPKVNSTNSIPKPTSRIFMSTNMIQTSQDTVIDSTQVLSIFTLSSSTPSSVSMTGVIPEQASSMFVSQIPSLEPSTSTSSITVVYQSSSQNSLQTSMGMFDFQSSISPTSTLGDVFPDLTSSKRDQRDSSIPIFTSDVRMISTIFPDKMPSATLAPTPSTESAMTTTSMATPALSSAASFVPTISSLSPSVLQPSVTPSIMPSKTLIPSTTVPKLSTIPSPSSAILQPTPTVEAPTSAMNVSPTVPGPSSRPPTTEKSTTGPLTMAQWIGVAVAATVVAVLILCIVIWWLLRAGKSRSKHKPTYTIENVTIDYSRSTSNDPKDVWRNSLLLESMSARIVVPEEDDDEVMQAKHNHGYEGFSDEEEQPSTSGQEKDVPLTKL